MFGTSYYVFVLEAVAHVRCVRKTLNVAPTDVGQIFAALKYRITTDQNQ